MIPKNIQINNEYQLRCFNKISQRNKVTTSISLMWLLKKFT